MAAARCWVPLTWLCSAFLFAEPHIRQGLVWLYTDGTDMVSRQPCDEHFFNLVCQGFRV